MWSSTVFILTQWCRFSENNGHLWICTHMVDLCRMHVFLFVLENKLTTIQSSLSRFLLLDRMERITHLQCLPAEPTASRLCKHGRGQRPQIRKKLKFYCWSGSPEGQVTYNSKENQPKGVLKGGFRCSRDSEQTCCYFAEHLGLNEEVTFKNTCIARSVSLQFCDFAEAEV